ncbi:DUF1992 domain-containing protein [Metabacillus herbersteinensis]|uniref:DUF1992 domain-containing protein n=1 Tax=Metabacillus herbersteinensis TaxID=283816 RepID=A0ABV6GGV7_9BACI
MDFVSIVSENKIRKAIEDGELNNLPGQGKPLQLEDLSHIPEELRIAYKVLKNAGMANEDVQLKKELMTIDDLIEACYDEGEKERLKKVRSEKQLRLETFFSKRKAFSSPASSFYKERALDRLK